MFNDHISFKKIKDANNEEHYVPYSNWSYGHFPFLPSETDEYIKYFEYYRDHFTDEQIVSYNKKSLEMVFDYHSDTLSRSRKTIDFLADEHFNFARFDEKEYNRYLSQCRNYLQSEIYDIDTILKEGFNIIRQQEGEAYILIFFDEDNISKIRCCTHIFSYIGSHRSFGDRVFIRKIPGKYAADLVFELKFIYGLLLNENTMSLCQYRSRPMRFALLKDAKRMYRHRYGIASKSEIWESVEIYAHIRYKDIYKEVIIKPDLDRYIRSELAKKQK